MTKPERINNVRLRIAVVTTHPPGKGTLNEYGYHFVRFLRQKPEVEEVILLVDGLAPGKRYDSALGVETGPNGTPIGPIAPVQFVPCWDFNAWNNPLHIRTAVKRAHPDAVLFNIQFTSFGDKKIPATLGLMTPALVKAMGIPTIVLLHNIMETVDLESAGFAGNPLLARAIRLFGALTTRLLLRADLLALTIPRYVEIIEEKYGADNVVLTPHGSFREFPQPSYKLPDGPLQIMTFGKFGTYKKVEVLIEAVGLLREAESRPPLAIVIAGSDSPNAPGYLAGVQERYADVPGLRFTGYVPEEDVPRIFQEAAVVVFPYTSTTGSSGVLHQAGSYGKAAVLPHLGDFAEIITEEGYAGEFFEPENPQSLADAIAYVIDDPVRRVELGRRNYAASRGLPIAEVVDWYLLHLQTLLDKQ